MEPWQYAVVLVAGIGAGTINTIVGSGTLITFPTLVGFGIPPVSATMSNAIGLVAGGLSGSFGYRRELRGQGARVVRFLPASILGALTGSFLLLHLPEDAFITIVPVLLVLALVLIVTQPWITAALRRRRERRTPEGEDVPELVVGKGRWFAVIVAVYLCGVYGGYFTAAQGILLVGALGLLLPDDLQRHNAMKNVLSTVVNVVAALMYLIVAFDRIDWAAAGLIALGSTIGGVLGASIGRRLPSWLLRGLIVVLGVYAIYAILTL